MEVIRGFLYLVHISQAVPLLQKARAYPFSKLEPTRAYPSGSTRAGSCPGVRGGGPGDHVPTSTALASPPSALPASPQSATWEVSASVHVSAVSPLGYQVRPIRSNPSPASATVAVVPRYNPPRLIAPAALPSILLPSIYSSTLSTSNSSTRTSAPSWRPPLIHTSCVSSSSTDTAGPPPLCLLVLAGVSHTPIPPT